MQTATVENGRSTAVKLGHLAAKVSEGKILAEDVVEIGKRKAKRMYRRGHDAAEDYLEDSTHYIKHNPWRSMGIALGVGIGLGFLSGLLCRRG